MIPDDVLATLPDDPELAFVHLEKKFREELNVDLEHAESNALIEACYRQYINLHKYPERPLPARSATQ